MPDHTTSFPPSQQQLHLPVNYSFNLGVFLHLLLPQPPLTVLEAVLVLKEDLIGLLLLREEPAFVLLQLFVGHHEALLQGVDLLLVLPNLRHRWGQDAELEELVVVAQGLEQCIFSMRAAAFISLRPVDALSTIMTQSSTKILTECLK